MPADKCIRLTFETLTRKAGTEEFCLPELSEWRCEPEPVLAILLLKENPQCRT